MATVEAKKMTADEFVDWLDTVDNGDKVFELERGEVLEMPSPGELHGVVCGLITYLLWKYIFQRGKGYLCSNDTGLLVEQDPDTLRGSDIMLFDESRRLDQMSRKYTAHVPKLVVEVRSPHDQPTKMTHRVGQYLQRGVALVWLVDPEVRSVTVCRNDRFPKVLDETLELTGEEVLLDLRLRVADLFALPGETIEPAKV
jgi:Uma2 family endonuclease